MLISHAGACFPVFAARRAQKGTRVSRGALFVAKFFGSGIIIATAFIHVSQTQTLILNYIFPCSVPWCESQRSSPNTASFSSFLLSWTWLMMMMMMKLLAPAHEALSDPCLTGPITEYPWVEGISLMTVFVLFFTELIAMRYSTFGRDDRNLPQNGQPVTDGNNSSSSLPPHTPGGNHLGHSRAHDVESVRARQTRNDEYAAQMTAIFILEFGVIFHSIFIGLTLAVAGEEFKTLYIVLVFHQTFEGLGLGSRLAEAKWPKSKQLTPYLLGVAYGFSTPIAIAIGLGVRKTFAPGSQTALMVNGIFDSISAGILIYTGLVELMAHEFMFSPEMRKAKLSVVLSAFATMILGAGQSSAQSRLQPCVGKANPTLGLMALLGKWA